MLKPWSDFWIKKPTVDMVLETFADAILNRQIDDLFKVEIHPLRADKKF
jgi:hypothetical protein